MARDAASFALALFQQRRQPPSGLRLLQPEVVLLTWIVLEVVKLIGSFTEFGIDRSRIAEASG